MNESRFTPQWIKDIRNTIFSFNKAVWRRDEKALTKWIAPHTFVDWVFRIWGPPPLGVLLKLYLGDYLAFLIYDYEKPRDKRARVQAGWGKLSNGNYYPAEGTELLVHVQFYRNRWRVSDIQQGTFEEPVTLTTAYRMFDQASEEELETNREKWLSIALEVGALQPPLQGQEKLDDVEILFLKGMSERSYSLREQISAIRIWRDFKKKVIPTYRKPSVYAAAIEYIVSLLGFWDTPQKMIGEAYGVSPGTVGRKTAEIEQSLKLVQWDKRYCCFERPHPEVWEMLLDSELREKLRLDKLGGRWRH